MTYDIRPSREQFARAYDLVASEYYDERAHPTCFNFNTLSRLYIQSRFPELRDESPVLEVGAGASAVAPLFAARGHSLGSLKITDASEAMLAHSYRWRQKGADTFVCPADDIPVEDDSFSYVVSSLGDPYNTQNFWRESSRIVKPGGRLIFTTPSFEWSSRFRLKNAHNSAEFVVAGNRSLVVPSFILPLAEQIQMMEAAGFLCIHFESLGDDRLHSAKILSPKLAVFGEQPSSIVWGFELIKRPHSARPF